jgi:hypothetical protein
VELGLVELGSEPLGSQLVPRVDPGNFLLLTIFFGSTLCLHFYLCTFIFILDQEDTFIIIFLQMLQLVKNQEFWPGRTEFWSLASVRPERSQVPKWFTTIKKRTALYLFVNNFILLFNRFFFFQTDIV